MIVYQTFQASGGKAKSCGLYKNKGPVKGSGVECRPDSGKDSSPPILSYFGFRKCVKKGFYYRSSVSSLTKIGPG